MKKFALLLLMPLLILANENDVVFRMGVGPQASKWGYGGSYRSWIKDRVGLDILVQRNWDGTEEGGEVHTMVNFAPSRSFAPYTVLGGGLTRVDVPEVGKGRNNGYLGYGSIGGGGELFWGKRRHGLSLEASYNVGRLKYESKAMTSIGSSGTVQQMKEIKAEPFSVSLAYNLYFLHTSKKDRSRRREERDSCFNSTDFNWFDENNNCIDNDLDGDGVPDHVDRCPRMKEDIDGFEDRDGCPDEDNDNDGFKDSVDKCPNEAEDMDIFADNDGCPEKDSDGDGINDILDECYLEPEMFNGFEDEDGCPEPDIDNDSIVNALDKCPKEPETMNGFEDEDGCPDEQEPIIDDSQEK